MRQVYFYNTLKRDKQEFHPIHDPHVGMYVCGPTVYGDPHLGHARSAITFDLIFRLLKYVGYKVRYVRNITDVGHLVGDADSGNDKIAEKAKAEQLEPMEVAQYYANRYHEFMAKMGVQSPSIEPLASGHIIEQIDLAKKILDAGFAYVSEGSVYFDVKKYAETYKYHILSGRNLDDMVSGGRSDDYMSEKHFVADFALWKKAAPEHIMRWPSPWSDGFPGWHAECSAMSAKYLGREFDIHGGGMDLMFPHHECEIAQTTAAYGTSGARWWIHNNMITINGKKMGKSYNNFITLEQFFKGDHQLLPHAYSPMTIRFFILQAHYRSTLDFSAEALDAAEKGLDRLSKAFASIEKIIVSENSTLDGAPAILFDKMVDAFCDDVNSPVAISYMFDAVKQINSVISGESKASAQDVESFRKMRDDVFSTLLGLQTLSEDNSADKLSAAMDVILDLRLKARSAKDWTTSDFIRDSLAKAGIKIKDSKTGSDWEID